MNEWVYKIFAQLGGKLNCNDLKITELEQRNGKGTKPQCWINKWEQFEGITKVPRRDKLLGHYESEDKAGVIKPSYNYPKLLQLWKASHFEKWILTITQWCKESKCYYPPILYD